MPLKQWVNLTRKGIHVADGISNEERLDYVQATVKLKKADPALLKLRAVPEGGDNIEYSQPEKDRNIHFQLTNSKKH